MVSWLPRVSYLVEVSFLENNIKVRYLMETYLSGKKYYEKRHYSVMKYWKKIVHTS